MSNSREVVKMVHIAADGDVGVDAHIDIRR